MGMKNLIAKIAGKIVRRKLGIIKNEREVGNMPTLGEVKEKAWWKSETNLSGLAIVAINIYEGVRLLAPMWGMELPPIPSQFYAFLNGLLGVSVVHGRNSAKSGIKKGIFVK